MKKWSRLFLFLLAFQMEVRVRASGDLLQQPVGCLKDQGACAIQVTGPALHHSLEKLKLHASEGSTLVRVNKDKWRFVSGALWVEEGQDLTVETLYGELLASQGQYFVIEQGSKVLIRNIDATLSITLRDGKVLSLPEGFEFWIAGVNSSGKSDYGVIQPIDMKSHLPLWVSLYPGEKKDFIKLVTHVRENWGDLTEKSSLIYKTIAQREIASIQEKERVLEQKRAKAEAERQKLKALYHQRVFER